MELKEIIIQILLPVLSALGLGGGGLLYFRARRDKEQSEGMQAKTQAAIAEINAYCKRVESLSGQVIQLQKSYDEQSRQLQAALDLNAAKDKVIDSLNGKVSALTATCEELRQENASLREINVSLQRRNSALKATAAKVRKATERTVSKSERKPKDL